MLLSQLHPNEGQIKGVPSNPRYITDEDFAALKKSLRDFRKMLALRPMIVDEDFNILGGNMRYQALCRLRDEKVKVGAFAFGDEIPDEWVKQDCTLSEKEKREFVIKDNQERGQNDWDKLANEWDASELQEWGVDAAFWEQKDEEEDEYERKKREFEERMANGENMTEDERAEHNRKRRERYKNDEAYREKVKAQSARYGKNEAGRESNRRNARRTYYKKMIGNLGDMYFDD